MRECLQDRCADVASSMLLNRNAGIHEGLNVDESIGDWGQRIHRQPPG